MERFWEFCTDVLVQTSNVASYMAQNDPWVLAVIVIFTFGQVCFLLATFFWMVVRLFRGYPPKERKIDASVKREEKKKGD